MCIMCEVDGTNISLDFFACTLTFTLEEKISLELDHVQPDKKTNIQRKKRIREKEKRLL